MNYTHTFDGGELECELDYEPADRGARENGTGLQLEPDHLERAYLITATLKGVDISELLSSEVIGLIEAKALAK